MNVEKKKIFLIHIVHLFVVVALFYFVMKFCLNYILPIVIGLVAAVAVQKPAEYLSRRFKIKKNTVAFICAMLVYLLLFTLIGGALFWAYLKLAQLYPILPEYFKSVYNAVSEIATGIKDLTNRFSPSASQTLYNSFDSVLQNFLERVADFASSAIGSFAAAVPGLLFSTLVAVITGCYIAKDFEKLKNFLLEAFPKKYIKSLVLIRNIAANNTFGIIKGYFKIALIAFIEIFVLFLIFGISGAFKKAILISAVDMLPVFGAGTVLLPWAIIAAISGKFTLLIKLIVVYLVVSIVRNMLEPKILGEQIGIHPVITLLTIFIGLKIFGVVGILVLPLTVTVLIQFLKEKYKDNLGDKNVKGTYYVNKP